MTTTTASAASATPKPKKSKWPGIVGACVVMLLVAMCSTDKPKTESTEAEKPAETCAKDNLQCNGDGAIVAAGVYCKDPIERLAKHSVRWIDGTFDTKFSRFRWLDKAAGTLTMIGDKAEFQNGFGAYTRMIYECDLAIDRKTVLDARVREGRLPN